MPIKVKRIPLRNARAADGVMPYVDSVHLGVGRLSRFDLRDVFLRFEGMPSLGLDLTYQDMDRIVEAYRILRGKYLGRTPQRQP